MAEFNLFKIIKEGTKAVPATKYAVGVAGLIAIVALIASFKIDLRIALWGTIVLFGLMILLVLFAKLSQTASEDFKTPVRVLMWSFTIVFISISILLTSSVFFKVPIDLQFILVGNHVKSDEKKVISVSNVQNDSTEKETLYKQGFRVNYMRLFGAGGVPSLMRIIESKFGIVKNTNHSGYYIKGLKNNGFVSDNLANFWIDKWEYKNAMPIETKLWEQFSGKVQLGFDIYWTALSPKIEDIMAYAKYDGNEMGDWDDDLPAKVRLKIEKYVDSFNRKNIIPYEESYEKIGLQSNDIGYLFIIITNSMDSEISEIGFIAKEFNNNLTIQKKNYLLFESKSNPRYFALNDDSIRNSKKYTMDTLMLASLEPQKSIIWFLGAYKKKENSLPDFYLTDLLVPQKIMFRIGSTQYYDTIRQPYGIKAARLFVPNGWYSQ